MKAGVEPARGPRPVARCARSARPARRCRPRASAGSTSTSAPDTWLFSTSGGTDLCTAFVGGVPAAAGLRGRAAGALAGRRRSRPGTRTGKPLIGEVGELVITAADALDAALLLERRRRRALPRGLLRHLPRHLAPRRLDRDHRRAARRSSPAAPTRRSTAAASAWARPRSTARCWPSTRSSTRSSSTSRATARTRGCRCSSCCARARRSTTTLIARDPHGASARTARRATCPNEIVAGRRGPAHAVGQGARAAGQADPDGRRPPSRRRAATRSPTRRRWTSSWTSRRARRARARGARRWAAPPGARRPGCRGAAGG